MEKKSHILLADDESNIRLMLLTALESEQYTLEEATNGREAIEAIGRRVPDLMILDLNMPTLDGLGVLSELKARAPKRPVRVIVLTAYGSIPAAVKATRLGAMDFLEKPVTPEELRETVRSALDEPEPAPHPAAENLAGGYAGVLNQVRKALRLADYATAESMLMKASDLAIKDAAYFNLLGVLYEAHRDWRLARKFYGKAITTDNCYEPAQKNMRRLYELRTFGRTREPVTLGDEIDLWFARLPGTPAQPRQTARKGGG